MFVFSDDFVHLGGSRVNNKSFLDIMICDFVVTNEFDLDGATVEHFEQSDTKGKGVELDQFQPFNSSRNKAIQAANYTTEEDVLFRGHGKTPP